MAQFMLLLHENPSGWGQFSPEEMQKIVEKYMAWGKKPFIRGGQRLAEDVGRVLRAEGGKVRATDGPYSETKEVLGGLFTIEAADYDEAVRLSMDHPHLEYGQTIELRKIWGT
jgi:hypothetical protein